MSAKRVARFIETLSGSDASMIVVYHLTSTMRLTQVAHYEIEGNAIDLTSVIWEQAVNYAAGLPGTQTLVLKAFEKGDIEKESPLASVSFRVSVADKSGGEEAVTESPTESGLLSMSMRFTDSMFRNFNMMVGATVFHLTRTVEKQSEQIEALLAQRTADAETREDLASQKHIRDVELKRIEAKVKRDEEMFSRVMSYLPVAINHLAGKELIRQRDTELELVAMELATQINMPQLDKLRDSGLLTPNQLVLFATMLEKVTKRLVTDEQKKKESAEAKALAEKPQATAA